MNYKVKVCGLKFPENILEVATCLPDFMGFIFYEKSKRFVGESFDSSILENLPPSIVKTGVFVNQSTEYIVDKIKKYNLSLLQLHGDETVEQCKALKALGYKITKAFQVDSDFDFKSVESYKAVVDYFLFDTKSDGYGGTGHKFDWTIFERYDNEMPIFLSGGLDLESIDEIKKMSKLNIYALDINSKFEVEAGRKDKAMVENFIKLAK